MSESKQPTAEAFGSRDDDRRSQNTRKSHAFDPIPSSSSDIGKEVPNAMVDSDADPVPSPNDPSISTTESICPYPDKEWPGEVPPLTPEPRPKRSARSTGTTEKHGGRMQDLTRGEPSGDMGYQRSTPESHVLPDGSRRPSQTTERGRQWGRSQGGGTSRGKSWVHQPRMPSRDRPPSRPQPREGHDDMRQRADTADQPSRLYTSPDTGRTGRGRSSSAHPTELTSFTGYPSNEPPSVVLFRPPRSAGHKSQYPLRAPPRVEQYQSRAVLDRRGFIRGRACVRGHAKETPKEALKESQDAKEQQCRREE